MYFYYGLKQIILILPCNQLFECYEKLHLKFDDNLSCTYKYISAHVQMCVKIIFRNSLVYKRDPHIKVYNSESVLYFLYDCGQLKDVT